MDTNSESYRDAISTVNKDGSRKWLYPKKPFGRYFNKRQFVSYFLLAFLFLAPWIQVNGEQLLLFNIIERKFVFFGQIFWPQDFYLFVFAMLTFLVFIILFTLVYGRLFCGWVCPQTIFMEMVFRRIEYLIEGDAQYQKQLNKKKGSTEYIVKKTIKHILFFGISWHIANTFLAYIIGAKDLFEITTDNPADHIVGLSSMTIFTLVFYGVFSKMREQVCTTICPYGRLQGALLDRNSLVVAYDYLRGEPRGVAKKSESNKVLGDCIDCFQCVKVCPTGIDIRNGTQLECVNCTACIDACDHIMDKINKPKGLIRFASEANIADSTPFSFSTKAKAYSIVLLMLFGSFLLLLANRSVVDATILRTPGMLYQKQENGKLSNLYNYKIINKSDKELSLEFKIIDANGELKLIGEPPRIAEQQTAEGTLFAMFDTNELTGIKTKFDIGIYNNDELIETIESTFVGPAN